MYASDLAVHTVVGQAANRIGNEVQGRCQHDSEGRSVIRVILHYSGKARLCLGTLEDICH